MDERGHERKVSETYLLDAVSFTEAEARIYKELQSMISGELLVSKIIRTNVTEIIPSSIGNRWYKAKVNFITIDENTGKEKRVSQFVLAFSDTTKMADELITQSMDGMMCDFEIASITESTIMDVLSYLQDESAILPLKPISYFISQGDEA